MTHGVLLCCADLGEGAAVDLEDRVVSESAGAPSLMGDGAVIFITDAFKLSANFQN